MNIIASKNAAENAQNKAYIVDNVSEIDSLQLSDNIKNAARKRLSDKNRTLILDTGDGVHGIILTASNGSEHDKHEALRKAGVSLCKSLNSAKSNSVCVAGSTNSARLALAEGIALSNYQFLKYYSDRDERKNTLSEITVDGVDEKEAATLEIAVQANFAARDLVNEPQMFLTATQYSKEMEQLGEEAGFSVEVFNKKKIEALKMGGLLAVNKGSVEPPTFNIMEWKPENAKNEKPLVLVGKGIVYDTGGLSLKPTGNSMDYMKCDMGGSAAVVGAIYAAAKAKLPIHVIALVPSTDNRPSMAAYAPGDVITMYSGKTVEVKNTDAEGRLVLADALTYALKYDPELVIDCATLTGSAARAIGNKGVVSMGNANQEVHDILIESGYRTHERLAQFPFWDDFNEQLKSHIADISNLGGAEAGMITAGKFLEHFTKDKASGKSYPYIHLDIAGIAFNHTNIDYRGVEGTGVGARLLFDFMNNWK